MKKLLLLIFILFGILSVQSFAWNYGCGENIPPDVCGAAPSYNTTSAPSVTYYGAIAIDPYTRKFYSSWNYKDGEEARSAIMKDCGKSCVSTWASYNYMVIAISESNKYWGSDASDNYDNAWNGAVNACQKSGEICHVALVGFPESKANYIYWGGLAYNPDTGVSGKSADNTIKQQSEINALKNAGCTQYTNCSFLAFQNGYAAFAKNESGQLFQSVSNKNLKDAEKNAVKACKKEGTDKKCTVVISSPKVSGK